MFLRFWVRSRDETLDQLEVIINRGSVPGRD